MSHIFYTWRLENDSKLHTSSTHMLHVNALHGQDCNESLNKNRSELSFDVTLYNALVTRKGDLSLKMKSS
jgi:hypothetical protein